MYGKHEVEGYWVLDEVSPSGENKKLLDKIIIDMLFDSGWISEEPKQPLDIEDIDIIVRGV